MFFDLSAENVQLREGRGRRGAFCITWFRYYEGLKYRILNFFLKGAVSLKKLTNIIGLGGKLLPEQIQVGLAKYKPTSQPCSKMISVAYLQSLFLMHGEQSAHFCNDAT